MTSPRAARWTLGGLGFAAVLAAWWIVADTAFAETRVVPSPARLVGELVEGGTGYYTDQIGVTLASAGQGYAWGAGLALAVAAVVMLLPRLGPAASQLALFVECAPAAAIGPVVLALVGGRTPSIFLAGLAVLFTTLVGSLLGVRAVRERELDVFRVYGASSFTTVRKLRLVASLPAIFTALKVGVPAAILGAIIGEYLGGVDSGIGVALAAAQRSIQVERTWILGLSAAAVTLLGYGLLGLASRVLLPWSAQAQAAAR